MKLFVSLPARILVLLLLVSSLAMGQQALRYRTPDGTITTNIDNDSPSTQIVAGSIPNWSGSFIFDGTNYPFVMVGIDPSVPGAGTTNVPVFIIPVRFKFGSTMISPASRACGDSVSVLARVKGSPLFTNKVAWMAGTTSLGKTQYADAFQRANFWNFVDSVSPRYHVRLKPVKSTPIQTVNVPAADGFTQPGPCGNNLGVVDEPFWLSQMTQLLEKEQIPPTALTIFLAYDIGMNFNGGNVRPLGGNGVIVGPTSQQTFMSASYTEPNAFVPAAGGISILSADLANWMDDPFLFDSLVPPYTLGPNPPCDNLMFPVFPLGGKTYSVVQNGVSYDVAEGAFLSWFARQAPSTAVNRWYSSQNTLTAVPPLCQ